MTGEEKGLAQCDLQGDVTRFAWIHDREDARVASQFV